jgi:ubiquinone/menaquinone biosynthesis C-methylase UbiE
MKDTKEAQSAYDQMAEAYHMKRIEGKDFNEMIEQPATFALLGDVKGKKILDAGCGSGIYTKILAEKGAKVQGLEISGEMLRLARKHCEGLGITFKQGSIDNLPYPNNSFDVVVASLVIHYLKNPEKAFREFNRVLKKNGTLIFSTHHPVMEAYEETQMKRGKKQIIIQDYFKTGKFYWHIHQSKVDIPSYLIGFEKLFDMLCKNNFMVEKFKEAHFTKKIKNLSVHHKRFIDMPAFTIIKCKKISR